MADYDANDRASRFDRADFGARQAPSVQKQSAEWPAQSPNRAAILPVGDERITAEYLKRSGWADADVQRILGGPAEPDEAGSDAASLSQIEAHLRSLGWTQSDIARLLVGPENSHLTAEALFRQHAANHEDDQAALVRTMALAGAPKVKLDLSLLEGLAVDHLSPDKPADLTQLISQFAALPDVQKQRFLLLLDTQKGSKSPTPSPSKNGGKTDGETKKTTSAVEDALPIVKGGLDLLNTALKGLLGSTKDEPKKGKGSVTPNQTDFSDEPYDSDDWSEPDEPDEFDEPDEETDGGAEDCSTSEEDETWPSEPDVSTDPDSESAPD